MSDFLISSVPDSGTSMPVFDDLRWRPKAAQVDDAESSSQPIHPVAFHSKHKFYKLMHCFRD